IYEFALRDSLTITLPERTIDVYELAVRPRDARAARVVGSVFLDRGSADIVRMALTFTDAAILDRRIERLSVVLENALIEGRFWLPRRQELEVARAGTWLDLPVRGIIRGSWQICCYQIDVRLDSAVFAGAPIVRAPLAQRRNFQWPEPLSEVLPADIAAVTEEDVARVQTMAQNLITRAALARTRTTALSARSLGDFARYNRVEGIALGIGTARQWGGRWGALSRVRYGIDDAQWKGHAQFTGQIGALTLETFAQRDYREGGDITEGSSIKNSLAAQEFGSDYTDPYDVRAFGGRVTAFALGTNWTLRAAHVRHAGLAVHATPARGEFEPTIPAWALRGTEYELGVLRSQTFAGGNVRVNGALRLSELHRAKPADSASAATQFGRGVVDVRYSRESDEGVLRVSGFAGFAHAMAGHLVPPQGLLYLGGPTSAPGNDFHSFRAARGAMLHAEYGMRIPFPSIPLARYGRSPGHARFLPYAHLVGIDRAAFGSPHGNGWYPSLGVALEIFFDLLRVEGARGLRDGRWSFSIDLSEGFRAIF
ncbi:MAG: hypothetical protein AB1762_04020, partial [Gemmatimonadota bacterium]